MAELTTIGYRTGSSVPHQMDVRFKLVIMLSLSLVSATANLTALVWFTLIVIGGMRHVRLPFGKTIAELRYLLFLLLLICLVRIFLTPGSSLLTFGLVSLSKEGFYAGLTVSWRILLIVLWGLLFVATTRVSKIRAAVVWFLRPFPKIPNQKAATMIIVISGDKVLNDGGLRYENEFVRHKVLDLIGLFKSTPYHRHDQFFCSVYRIFAASKAAC
ncbi:MAG: UDP-3-O-acyl-N-acetylglucosamine deacetylase, partial [Desulfobacterales bacterium]